MKRTISFMTGAGSTKHNERAFIAENVDKDRVQYNIEYCNEKIRDVYQKLFGEALEKYNAKQTRNDRRIENYYEKIRTGKQEFYSALLIKGTLFDYLENVDLKAKNEINRLIPLLAEKQGVTEQLKAENQLKWVGMMNNIRQSAEEIVMKDVVCFKHRQK